MLFQNLIDRFAGALDQVLGEKVRAALVTAWDV